MPPIDWDKIVGQGGFAFCTVAGFMMFALGARKVWNDIAKPSFEAFKTFLTDLTGHVGRLADASEKNAVTTAQTAADVKKLTDTNGSLQTAIHDLDAAAREVFNRLNQERIETRKA